MKALQTRQWAEGIVKHKDITPRNYFEDGVQTVRIVKSRGMVERSLNGTRGRVIELCAGTADISGPFAERHIVECYDCNFAALRVAADRFPGIADTGFIPTDARPCDVLIMCECLEHLPDPAAIVSAWGSLANHIVISHPIDGDLINDASAGEHQWSLSIDDFHNWFKLVGHEVIEEERFVLGGVYDIALARSRRL